MEILAPGGILNGNKTPSLLLVEIIYANGKFFLIKTINRFFMALDSTYR
jgi:hypothetical protein